MKKRKIDPLEEIMSNPYYQLRDDYNYAEKPQSKTITTQRKRLKGY